MFTVRIKIVVPAHHGERLHPLVRIQRILSHKRPDPGLLGDQPLIHQILKTPTHRQVSDPKLRGQRTLRRQALPRLEPSRPNRFRQVVSNLIKFWLGFVCHG